MQALQLIYNGVNLHDCGAVSIVSQRTDFSPAEYPQKETRELHVRIDTFADDAGYNYDILYANIQAARNALKTQNGILKWTSPGDPDAGDTLLERPAIVVSHDLPENPNAVGVYHQQINIVFRYEFDLGATSGALTATVTGSAGTPTAISLGRVLQFKDDYSTTFYSEWKNNRRRSTGNVTCSGELFRGSGETGSETDTRMAEVLSDLTNLRAQIRVGQYITLSYGAAGAVFNQNIKVEAFNADIAQGPKTGVIKWSLTGSYTLFPDEDGFASAEVNTSISTDQATGMETLSLSGRIMAGTEALAVAKLNAVTSTMLTAYGFASTNQTRKDISKAWVNADDTEGEDTTQDGAEVADTVFMELSFTLGYEKKKSGVVSYTLAITDSDDLRSGLLTRTYSGSVVASGVTEDFAAQTALAQARTLGDKKAAFRVSAVETRSDRKMASQANKEFVRLEFQYVYQLKGERMYLEMTSSVAEETFGESAERVSGFVVASTLAVAQSHYNSIVRAAYASRLIRNEVLDSSQHVIQTGTTWYGAAGTSTMPIRLDFSLMVYKAKETGTYNIKYAVRVAPDYVGLTQNSSMEGVFAADATQLAALEAGTANQLDTFLANYLVSLGAGAIQTGKEISYDKEKVGSGAATTVNVRFACQYYKPLSTTAQVLRCSLSEDITYSGTRWVSQQTPDGVDTIQNCGTTQATRTVSGEVTAATEAACLAWVSKQHGATGLWSQWRDTAPATRYEEPISISTGWEHLPLTDGSVGTARSSETSTGANFTVATMRFQFREIIPNLAAPF